MSAWDDLAGGLAGVPLLAGARCKGRPDRFDLDVRSDRAAIDWAVSTCGACPALDACRTWVASLPADERPAGVVAARLTVDGRDMSAARAAMRAAVTAREAAA